MNQLKKGRDALIRFLGCGSGAWSGVVSGDCSGDVSDV
jgi:hypothetical protein